MEISGNSWPAIITPEMAAQRSVRVSNGCFDGTNIHGNLRYPTKANPPRNKALLRDYKPLVSLNKALLGVYFLGGWHWGGYLKFP